MATVATTDDHQDALFERRIQAAIATVNAWDGDPSLLTECRSQILIPLAKMEDANNNNHNNNSNNKNAVKSDVLYKGNALFLKRMTKYFKENVMTWVNNPPCVKCGCEQTESRTTRGPESEEERQGGASRVEVYYCPTCAEETTTFPRYNSCRKLLETRKGRCGEYANLFGLFCRSVGFETRYVSDFTDHVWVECLVDGHWIMADSCEGLIDKYSMYEHGWGKKLNYIIGVTNEMVVDVTPRYTRKWFDPDFQARRRSICSSEEASQQIIRQVNRTLHQSLSKKKNEELGRRIEREQKVLSNYQQATEWTEEEKHGQGRISGSLLWKVHRNEAGQNQEEKKEASKDNDENVTSVRSWHVESFYPCLPGESETKYVTISVTTDTGIVVSRATCSVVDAPICVVVIDEAYLGCILQSKGFKCWFDVASFICTLPKYRIVAIQGRTEETIKGSSGDIQGLSRLGGFTIPTKDGMGLLYVGQVEATPGWSRCLAYHKEESMSIHTALPMMEQLRGGEINLRTERDTVPCRVAWRLPESLMPLQTQLLATEEQKRAAFLRFTQHLDGKKRYVGYCTKPGSPIYLLDAGAYPFAEMRGSGWNTFHFLPKPLVPEDDNGIKEKGSGLSKVDIPLDPSFTSLLGPSLLLKGSSPGAPPSRIDTAAALNNTRLIGLYFSAHWCPPCRQFTPIVAEMYSVLKEEYPSQGLEIVFVSSDRDQSSFEQYFASMPWMSVPFESSATLQNIKARFGVRGIPALVILDAMSGQIVVPMSETRSEVMQACQGGEARIETMLESWIAHIPQESQEILTMLALSCDDSKEKPSLEGVATEHPYLIKAGTEGSAAAIDPSSFESGPLNNVEWKTKDSVPVEATMEIASHVASLNHSGKAVVNAVVSTALKYLENAKKEPWTPKFRSFKLGNKIVDRITQVERALDLICSLGLYVYPSEADFMVCIPLAKDLNKMEKEMKDVLEKYPPA